MPVSASVRAAMELKASVILKRCIEAWILEWLVGLWNSMLGREFDRRIAVKVGLELSYLWSTAYLGHS
jgi:hypothetical protein